MRATKKPARRRSAGRVYATRRTRSMPRCKQRRGRGSSDGCEVQSPKYPNTQCGGDFHAGGYLGRLGPQLLNKLMNCFIAGESTLFFLWIAASGRKNSASSNF